MAGVDIKGTRFEYSELGCGETLVFVHGSASDYRTWSFQQGEFAKYYRTITYSRRYHWPNEPIPDGIDYSMESHTHILTEISVYANGASVKHLRRFSLLLNTPRIPSKCPRFSTY